jgi:malate/lactate dehydrogenase
VKVAIVGGAGGVGSSAAFNLLRTGDPYEIALVDVSAAMTTSHLMDLEQALELSPGCSLRAGDAADVAEANVVVLSAAAPLTVNTSRLVYLADNARIVEEAAELLPPGWPGVLLVVTNPVDPLVTRLQSKTRLDRRRVLGYTLNDTLRLRTGLAQALGVPAGQVEAWVMGEHGDLCVPLFDRVAVGGRPVRPTAEQAASAEEYLRTWYTRHVALDSGRSSTWTSGLGVARMVSALGREGEELWPASVVLEGEYGIDAVAISVPVSLGRGGVARIHEWDLSAEQLAALRSSAELVRGAAAGIDAPAPA